VSETDALFYSKTGQRGKRLYDIMTQKDAGFNITIFCQRLDAQQM